MKTKFAKLPIAETPMQTKQQVVRNLGRPTVKLVKDGTPIDVRPFDFRRGFVMVGGSVSHHIVLHS